MTVLAAGAADNPLVHGLIPTHCGVLTTNRIVVITGKWSEG